MVLAEAAPKSTTCSSNESESNLENVPDANEAKRVKNTKESPKKGNSRQQSIKSKRGKRKVSHFGDENFSIETNQGVATRLTLLDEDKVSREEIYQSCCIHTSWEWARILAGVVALLVCLYFFCFGLQLMGNASKVMAGCASGELFGSNVRLY